MRLVEQSSVANWRLGRLEVLLEGSWGQLCSPGFTGLDANVACRQLDFGAGAIAPQTPGGTFAQTRRGSFTLPTPVIEQPLVEPEVVLTGGPGCEGSEARLLDCVNPGSQ